MVYHVVAEKLGFTEGPLWMPDGRLLLVSVNRGLVCEVGQDGYAGTHAEVGGNPSGLACDSQGRIWIAQGGLAHGSRSLRIVRPGIQCIEDGQILDVTQATLNAPNDLCFGPDGRLWFTDPRGPAMTGTSEPGQIYALDTANGALQCMADDLHFPNGLAFGPDGEALYIAETFTRRILRFAFTGGALGPAEVFAALPMGHPDGLAFDRDGHLHVAATSAGAVIVIGPDGTVTETLELEAGTMPTNLCFGGDDGKTLFITIPKGGRVLSIERTIPGLPLL